MRMISNLFLLIVLVIWMTVVTFPTYGVYLVVGYLHSWANKVALWLAEKIKR